jgi:hypothetical protein
MDDVHLEGLVRAWRVLHSLRTDLVLQSFAEYAALARVRNEIVPQRASYAESRIAPRAQKPAISRTSIDALHMAI